MSAVHSIDSLGSVAASGNVSTTISLPQGTQKLAIVLGVEYAAVAATSGVTVALQTSVDGTTFVTANETAAEIKPAAGVLGTETLSIQLGDSPFRLDAPSRLAAVKLTLTNTDATNAATYTVTHNASTHQL